MIESHGAIDLQLHRMGYYSPLRYPGGKASLAPFLGNLLKRTGRYRGTFVEPYAGGGGAALTLLLTEKVQRILINDLDEAIFAFWWSVVNRNEPLIERIQKVEVTVDEWRKQRGVYLERKTCSTFDLGFATFFLNRTSRSGIIEGWPIGGLKQEGSWKIDVRFNKEELIDRIRRIGFYKERIDVRNLDALRLTRSTLKSQNTFTYLDPPYYKKGGSLYLNHYGDAEHAALAALLNERSDAYWVLTYDNVPAIKALYSERVCHEFNLRYSAYEKVIGSELMILSNSIAEIVRT